jgi:tetratricopeptide (TPR) repeat protein
VSTIPTSIGRYQVVKPLGRGGMGWVYLARDPSIDRLVAIKLLREGLETEELRERFVREARTAGRLRHANIVIVFDVGDHQGQPFIAMEYLPGQTLADLIKQNTEISPNQKLHYLEQLCSGLGYAHREGVVHRDIKPANLIVDEGSVLKILDFGIARIDSSGMTRAGSVIGTLNYMSPEQISGQQVDQRSDIFAVGAVCYELLSYRRAFPGDLQDGILHKILVGKPEPLEVICPDLEPEVVAIVYRALEKDPSVRYQDLETMQQELARVRQRLTGSDWHAAPAQPVPGMPAPLTHPPTSGGGSGARRGTNREEALRLRLQQIDQLLATARTAFAAANWEEVFRCCQQVLVFDPDNETAVDLSERARAARDEQQVHKLLAEAQGHVAKGDLEKARQIVGQALTSSPRSRDALDLRARIEAAAKDQERVRVITEALERGERDLAQGSFDSAIAAVEQALALEPGQEQAAALRERARDAKELARRRAEEERARREAEAAERARVEARVRLIAEARARGERALTQGSFEAAEAAADQALALDPAHQAATNLKRRALAGIEGARKKAEEERARREAEATERARAEARARSVADALARGERALALGNLESALAAADQALALDPSHQAAANLRHRAADAIEDARRRAEEHETAREEEEAAEDARSDTRVRQIKDAYQRGDRAFAESRYDAALAAADEMLLISPGDSVATDLRRRALEAIRRTQAPAARPVSGDEETRFEAGERTVFLDARAAARKPAAREEPSGDKTVYLPQPAVAPAPKKDVRGDETVYLPQPSAGPVADLDKTARIAPTAVEILDQTARIPPQQVEAGPPPAIVQPPEPAKAPPPPPAPEPKKAAPPAPPPAAPKKAAPAKPAETPPAPAKPPSVEVKPAAPAPAPKREKEKKPEPSRQPAPAAAPPAAPAQAATPVQAAVAVAAPVAPAAARPAAKRSSMPLIAGAGALLVVVLAVVGFMVFRGGKQVSAASGTAVLTVAPWANIDSIISKADGKKVAGGDLVTPCVVSLPAGEYTVRASNPGFSGPLEFNLRIVEGQVQEVRQVIPGFKPEDEVARILGR